MPGAPFGPALRSTSTSSALTSSSGSSIRSRHVLDRFEHHGAAVCCSSFGRRRRMLDDRAARREVAAQHRHAASGLIGWLRGRITSCPGTSSALATTSRKRAAGDGLRVEVDADRRARCISAARRRHSGSAPCSARPTASGRPAPAPRGRVSSNSSRSMRMPGRPAIAVRWTSPLVEPPIACSTTSALRNAASVRISLGFGPPSRSPSRRRRLPLASAKRRRSACGAGIVAAHRQRHAQRLDDAGHGAGGAHHHAGADRRRQPLVDRFDLGLVDLAGAVFAPTAGGNRCRRRAPRPCDGRPASARPAARRSADRR